MNDSTRAAVPAGIALYMAAVQFLFVTTWTIYVIYLPKLLESAGLRPSLTPIILIIDQLVFMAMDIYVGVAADRAQKTLGKVGPLVIGMTVVSCVAFLLLPHARYLGAAAPVAALGLMLVWTATSSALRAPPWVLLSKYAAEPSVPRLNTLLLCGLAAGGAIAPYLGVTLKNVDPRLPFALSSLTLLAATVGILYVERRLKLSPVAPPSATPEPADVNGKSWLFLLGLLLLAVGFQIHYSINSAAQYLKFAKAENLEWLMPVFWLGFGVAMMPGSALCKRFGTFHVMVVSAVLGAFGAYAAASAGSLNALIAAQVVAGGAWGSMLMCGFNAAMAAGRTGREGLSLGLLFAVLAAATLSRIATVLSGAPKQPDYSAMFSWAPALCWLVGALLIGVLVLRRSALRA
jgi:MFS family permease